MSQWMKSPLVGDTAAVAEISGGETASASFLEKSLWMNLARIGETVPVAEASDVRRLSHGTS